MATKLQSFTALVGNELWNLGGDFQFDFNAKPNTVEEVLQNVYEIWSVPIYTQPYLRNFGNDVSWIDAPANIAQLQLQVAFLLACAKWEPRAKFTKIDFSMNTTDVIAGKYSLYVELEIDLSVHITNTLFSAPPAVTIWTVDNPMDGSTAPFVSDDSLTI
jgi:phage baseplate assembly protein W